MIYNLNVFTDIFDLMKKFFASAGQFFSDVIYFFDFLLSSLGQVLSLLVGIIPFLTLTSGLVPAFLGIFFTLYILSLVVRLVFQLF